MFSKSCTYAIKVMVYLALQQKEEAVYIGVTEVSKGIASPKHFTAKILQQLSKAKLIDSQRGPNGGFCLIEGKNVSLADIVRVIDGNQLLEGCFLNFEKCSDEHPCPAHSKLTTIRKYLNEVMITTNIDEMKQIVENGNGFLRG